MTAGEAVTWVAASAPTVHEVIARAIPLNPGKLGLHDVALHLWMRLFGDGVIAQRTLSAVLGVLSILFTFSVVRELLVPAVASGRRPDWWREWIAAVAALLVALNPPLIHHSREARMYTMLVAVILAQVWFFLRAIRVGGWSNYAGVVVFSALGIAAHFTAGSVMLAEVLWLVPGWLREGLPAGGVLRLRGAVKPLAAVAAAGIMVVLILRVPLYLAFRFFREKGFRWVRQPPLLAPIEFLIMGLGDATNGPVTTHHRISYAFVVMLALAVWGAISGWRFAKGAVTFALLWIFVPTLLPQMLSYLISPFFLLEYALSSFIPFLILAALGMREIGTWRSYAVLALALAFSVAPVRQYRGRQSPTQWRAATELASASLHPGETAMLDPDWTIEVIHYYTRNEPQTPIESAPYRLTALQPPFPNVLIITDYAAEHDPVGRRLLSMNAELLQKFEGVSVFRLSPQLIAPAH